MKMIPVTPEMHFALAEMARAKESYAKANPVAERDAFAIYDGREYLGQLVDLKPDRRRGFDAYDADDDFVGTYPDRHEALLALKSERDARRLRTGGPR